MINSALVDSQANRHAPAMQCDKAKLAASSTRSDASAAGSNVKETIFNASNETKITQRRRSKRTR